MAISSLNRKLVRDLWRMRGQGLAIALVVAAGVSMYVMYLGNFASLRAAGDAYYERQRFADVFASLKRAPISVAQDVSRIPGVAAIEARVVADVTLDLPQIAEPATARLVSIPADRRPLVNDLFLRRGRWISGDRPDEVIASEAFVTAHQLDPGATVRAIINGRLRRLVIVGVALSPEYVYNIRPGELIPDDKRFGVFWMGERALASAFDMEGGFNDIVLAVEPAASVDEVVLRLDRLLERYGGRGSIPRRLQLSNWTLQSELNQLQSFGLLLPLIFLLVAAFVLNIALTRALALQRPQIASLKALGYGNGALAWHYLKWALMVASAGIVLGFVVGAWLGHEIGDLYNKYFRFPALAFGLPLHVAVEAVAMTVVAAAAGAFSAVRRAVSIPPAEAMRPEGPAHFTRAGVESPLSNRLLGLAERMVLRNTLRHPLRAAASVFGIAFAVAILMMGLVFLDGMDRLITTEFWVAERQDVTITFVEPRSAHARFALAGLPGVVAVEPQRSVPARIRHGHRERYLAVTGVDAGARLRRIVDQAGRAMRLAPSGVVISKILAEALGAAPGDVLEIEVLEGARPRYRAPITSLVDDVIGMSVYMDIRALHQIMREDAVETGALLLVDTSMDRALAARLKTVPAVAGASFKRAVVRSFRETMAANMNVSILINVIFAAIIACGVVYNSARVSLSERSHELASLRVLGFSRAEISLILMTELALLTILALPVGWLFGYGLLLVVVQTVQSEVYRFPLYVSRWAVAWAWLATIGAAVASGLLVRRRLDRLDLIAVLKVRE